MSSLRRELTIYIREVCLIALKETPEFSPAFLGEGDRASVVMLQDEPYTAVSIDLYVTDGPTIRGIGFSKCARYDGHMADDWNPDTGMEIAAARAAQQITRHIKDYMLSNIRSAQDDDDPLVSGIIRVFGHRV
jgi:hypothetical protein